LKRIVCRLATQEQFFGQIDYQKSTLRRNGFVSFIAARPQAAGLRATDVD